jgi:hypothetical protein
MGGHSPEHARLDEAGRPLSDKGNPPPKAGRGGQNGITAFTIRYLESVVDACLLPVTMVSENEKYF